MSVAGNSPTPGGDDWTNQVADTIESVVGAVRDKTTKPVVTIARALVYGLVAAVFGVALVILLTITAVRVLDLFLPIWAAYLLLGGIFLLAGGFLWTKAWARSGS